MDTNPLSKEKQAALGATHSVRITHGDLTETAEDTAQTLALTVPDKTLFALVGFRLDEAFQDAGDAALDDTKVSVGDGGSGTRYLAAKQVNANGTTVNAAAGKTFGHAYDGADTVDFLFGSMTGKSLSDIDRGDITFYVKAISLNAA